LKWKALTATVSTTPVADVTETLEKVASFYKVKEVLLVVDHLLLRQVVYVIGRFELL